MKINLNIDDYMEASGVTDMSRVVSNTLYGFKHNNHLPMIPSNKDYNGHVFFTRPQLNLTDRNLKKIRHMYKFLNKEKLSIQRTVRCLLDPRLQYGVSHPMYKQDKLSAPLVDQFSPFIPVMSNTIKTLSGWPDITTPTYTSSAGLRKEQWAMVDGTYEVNDVFELNAVFMNFVNEPISTIMELWNRYPSLVFEGSLYPYIDFILENEFDYNTRIYRFITDENGIIKKSAATGASFPLGEPTGKAFDLTYGKSYSEQNKDITVKFVCMGANYNDDITLLEFNKTAAIFNTDVRQYLQGDTSHMEVIPRDLLQAFENRGYPIVDLDTYELKWIINKNDKTYKRVMSILKDNDELSKIDRPIY